MNDRYLYRAKRTDNGEWVEGNLVWSDDADDDYKAIIIPTTDSNMFTRGGARGDLGFENWCRVDPSTICQCTGLKDKNGKLIWENDILSISKKMDSIGNYHFPPVKYPVNVFVRWDLCAWLWETISKNKKDKYYISFPDAWCHYEAEVVGNIFDNPELMNE